MLPTGLVAHERYFWHDPGRGAGFSTSSIYVQPDRHPEDPDTKRRLLALLEVSGQLDHLLRIAPRPATMEELLSFHTPRYIEHVRTLSEGVGGDAGDSATVGHGSYEIALLSTGGCLAAGEAVLGGRARNAYALVRPPGHHAEADSGRGYCLFGNAVILVKQARQQHGAARVAVVDWDVHHGNGTESAFIDDPSVLTISVHQDHNYPVDAGSIDTNGTGRGLGANINIPLPAGSGQGAYLATFERVVVPALLRFRPDLIVIASGLDAAIIDPNGRMLCTSETFRLMTRLVMQAADAVCGGRIVATHEGGYSNAYVPFCGLAVIEELSGRRSPVIDPYLAEFEMMGGHALLPHQEDVIDAAAKLVERVPAGVR